MEWSQVAAFAPELASVSAEVQAAALAAAGALDSAAFTEGTSELAAIWYAAHIATEATTGGTPQVSAESGGGLSVTYMQPETAASVLATTKYGVRFLMLLQTGPGAVVCEVVLG